MKLTDETIIEIRKRRVAGASLATLAHDYGISESMVSLITRGKRHSDVDGPLVSKYRRDTRQKSRAKRIKKKKIIDKEINRKRGLLSSTKQVFRAIVFYWGSMGFSPSIRELVELTDLSSTSVINYHLIILEQFGYITRVPGFARSIVVKKDLIKFPPS